MYVQTPSYEVVQNYIKHGLPEDHWSFDSANSSRKRKLATWHDTLTGEYNDFPPYALFSARFMDGLTSSMYFQDREFNDAYACAGCRSKNCTWWHEKFVQHAGPIMTNNLTWPTNGTSVSTHNWYGISYFRIYVSQNAGGWQAVACDGSAAIIGTINYIAA